MRAAGRAQRVAVAVLFEGALARKLERWRRSYDPRGAYRMPPHIPLAGPTLWEAPLQELERDLWRLCHDRSPFEVELLDLATTYPEGRLVFAEIGAGAEALEELSAVVAAGAMKDAPVPGRLPRLVVAEPEDGDEARSAAAQLAGLPVRATRLVDRVHLLVEYPDTSWYVRDFFTLDRAVARL